MSPPPGGYGYPAYMPAAVGEYVAITLEGVAEAVASEAIAADTEVAISADGKVGPHVDGAVAVGRTITAAAADGDVVEIFVYPTQEGLRRLVVQAAAAIAANRLVQMDGTYAAADQYGYPAQHAAAAAADVAVTLSGPAKGVASAAIAAGAQLEAAADGKLATHGGNAVKVGRAIEAAAADGDVIRYIVFPN